MKIKSIYVIPGNKLGEVVSNWSESNATEVISKAHRTQDYFRLVEGTIIFHENHNFNREVKELLKSLSKTSIAIHKVDLNGTLAATRSNFEMWLENNSPKSLLIIGDSNVAENQNLSQFLKSIDQVA